jgi:hypothetical protein
MRVKPLWAKALLLLMSFSTLGVIIAATVVSKVLQDRGAQFPIVGSVRD